MDLDKIKRNVGRMVDQGAPEADIDQYLATEGTTPEALRAGKAVAPREIQDEAKARRKSGSGFQRRAASYATFGFDDEILAGGESGITAIAGKGLDYDRALAVQREIKRQDVEESGGAGLSQIPAAVMGGLMAVPGGAVAAAYGGANALAQGAKMTWAGLGGQIVQNAPRTAGYGAAFGGAQAFGDGEGGLDKRLSAVPGGAVDGSVGALVLGSGLQGAIGARGILKQNSIDRSNALASQAQNRVDLYRDLDLEAPGFLVSQSPTVRATAQGLANSVSGAPIRNRAAQISDDLTARAQETLRRQTDGVAPSDLGAEIQTTLRQNVVGRNRTSDDFDQMTMADLERYTGPITEQGFAPPRPKIEPTAPRDVPDIAPEPVTALAPPSPIKAYTPEEVPLPPDLASRVLNEIQTERQVKSAISHYQEQMKNLIELRNEYMHMVANERPAAGGPASDGWVAPSLDARGPYGNNSLPSGYAASAPPSFAQKRLSDLNRKIWNASQPIRELEAQLSVSARNEARQYREKNFEMFSRDREASELARQQQEALSMKAQAEAEAARTAQARTEALRERARMDAEADTRARQLAADRAYEDEVARGDYGFKTGRTREPYNDEFGAAYQVADRESPSVLSNPLLGPSQSKRAPDATSSKVSAFLDDFGKEQRSGLKLKGYADGQPYGPDGRINPDLLLRLKDEVGPEVAARIAEMSERRFNGQLMPAQQGLRMIRTEIRRAADAAERPLAPGEVRTTQASTLRRLYKALSDDMDSAMRGVGNVTDKKTGRVLSGERGADIYKSVDNEYAAFMNDVRKPLAKLYGDKTSPVDALDKITKSFVDGDLRAGRAFMKVVSEKGDPVRSAAAVVTNLVRGAPDLATFAKEFGKLPKESRDLMFRGRGGEQFRRDLEAIELIAKDLQPYQKAIRQGGSVDLSSGTNLALAASAVSHVYASLVTAGGMALAARVLASPKYTMWLTKSVASQPSAMGRPNQRAMARLVAIAEQDGTFGEAVLDALKPSKANATIIGPRAENIDRDQYNKAQRLEQSGKSRDEIWKDTGWYKGKDGLWRFEIDDSTAELKPNVFEDSQQAKGSNEIQEYNLESIVQHPALFKAYPKLANAKVKIFDFSKIKFMDGFRLTPDDSGVKIGNKIYMNSAANWKDESFLGVLIHEAQHLIQTNEGRPYGRGNGPSNSPDNYDKEYLSRNGEYEAWNVQNRRELTPEQRKQTPPWQSTMDEVTEDDVYYGQKR
jgi:hypothetical protein